MTAWYIAEETSSNQSLHVPQILSHWSEVVFIKHGESVTTLLKINTGVPQGRVLGPILYLLFTYDLPVSKDVAVGTFADGTAILSFASNAILASKNLQESLNHISYWMNI